MADADSARITVILADDHPPTRAGVRATLEEAGFVVVGEFGDGDSAVRAVDEDPPDIALLDISMPGDGIAAASRIASTHPDVCVVMLTVLMDDDSLFAALRAGASGYLLKDTDPARLPDALRGALAGEVAIPRPLMRRVVDEFKRRGSRPITTAEGGRVSLTQREMEVLDLMCAGKTTTEIALALFVSKGTVRSHIAGIVHKLHARDRAEVIRLARQEKP
jgi:DNA-binding NarL/FixJ family response regulator